MGVPPLYKLEVGRTAQYCYTDEELRAATAGLAQGSYHVQRFKVDWAARQRLCGALVAWLALHGEELPATAWRTIRSCLHKSAAARPALPGGSA